MSKNELKGLQHLAKAHGGSLTVNPHTGLVEAGFLENMLPMVIGAGLAATGVGAPMAALMVAGGYGLATGSMEKGLIAGLGAYGGAGLGAGLAEAGAQSLVQEGGSQAVQQAATQSGTQLAAGTAQPGVEAALTPSQIQASNALNAQAFPNYSADQISGLRQASLNAANPMDVINSAGQGNAALAPGVSNPTFSQNLSNMGRGLPEVGSVMMQNPGTTMAAAFPLLQPNQQKMPGQYGPDAWDREIGRYRLSPNFQGSTPVQPNPYYQANYSGYAEGGLTDSYAPGGAVEQMSLQNQNQNQFYPQALQDTTQFATPSQMPTSAEVVRSDYEPQTNAYTGNMTMMASGGIAKFANQGLANVTSMSPLPESAGVPRTGIYHDSDVDTSRKDAWTAAGIRLGKIAKGANIKLAEMPKAGIKGLGQIDTEAEMAGGGTAHLGDYSDGGRMLKGPGDGMSDSIPASISGKQPARLADGEFVVPADVVSHLGNGSTDAGAKKLYSMMDNIRKARTGKKKQAPAVKADKFLPK
jgi:hypothetical protein